MSGMIGRVSRAIMLFRQTAAGPLPTVLARRMKPSALDIDLARAAIEAMREPTDDMCREGARAGGVRSTWVMMIDAALHRAAK